MGRPPLQVKPTVVRLPEDVRERIRNLVGAAAIAAELVIVIGIIIGAAVIVGVFG